MADGSGVQLRRNTNRRILPRRRTTAEDAKSITVVSIAKEILKDDTDTTELETEWDLEIVVLTQ